MPTGIYPFEKRRGLFQKGRKIGKKQNHPNWRGGLTHKQYRDKIQEITAGRKRADKCDICLKIGTVCFDHDHNTGKFRGWICLNCNFSLGLVKDKIETLEKMIDYLKKSVDQK